MRMNFDEAVEFILSRLDIPVPDQRATRDKVRKRIIYAHGNGSLPRLDIHTRDVDRNELIVWARKKWRGRFEQDKTIQIADCIDGLNLADSLSVNEYPNSVERCHELLRNANLMLAAMSMRMQVQDRLIRSLRPLAEQYERNRERNRTSARKPRDGRE